MITLDELKKIEEEKNNGNVPPDYTPEENEYRSKIIARLESAKEQRDKSQKEFDGMDYLTWYETNAQADMSYIPPKLNKEDVRVVTGTTREKDNTILSTLLGYNLDGNFVAYNADNMIVNGLGSTMEDFVKKSREFEDYDAKRPIILREMLTQGDVFVLEQWVTKTCIEKDVKFNWQEGVTFKDFEMTESLEIEYQRCESTLLSGTKVFQGNIKEPEFENQPYVFTVETVPYDSVKSMFMNWERWKFVPKKIVRMQETMDTTGYRDWTLMPSKENYVEIIKYFDRFSNEFQLFLNGTMMLPKGFPLKSVSPSGCYPITKGSVEQIPFFAYSKGFPAKTKVEQAVMDEMLKLAVLKTQASFKPAMANNTGRELSSSMFMPGSVVNDVDVAKLQPIVAQNGVTQSELGFMQYMKEVMDLKSVGAMIGGEQMSGKMTATQVIEQKKQQLMKLGLVVWGAVQFERTLQWKRVYNIVEHWTDATDEKVSEFSSELDKVYKTISVDTDLEDGRKGRKIYEFNPQMANSATEDQIRIEEELLSLKENMPVRKMYINPQELKKAKLIWKVTVTPTENNSTELQRALFVQNIQDAATIFGPQSLNMEYLKQRFAILAKEDPEKFFMKIQPMSQQMGNPMEQPQQMGNGAAQNLQQMATNPTVKQMASPQ